MIVNQIIKPTPGLEPRTYNLKGKQEGDFF